MAHVVQESTKQPTPTRSPTLNFDTFEPTAVTTPAKGVTDTTLAAIDLAKEPIAAKDRQLRFRKLTIEPNGIVPWHSHTDRPAIIFVQQGEIYEYASNCAVPILHKEGEIRPEVQGTSPMPLWVWWRPAALPRRAIVFPFNCPKDKHFG